MRFVPRTPSFANLSFLELPAAVTGHSYLLYALRVFVAKRGLTCMQNVSFPLTHSSDCLSSSVCNLMRRGPIHLLPPASGARRSPPI